MNLIEQWIDQTNSEFKEQRVCCSQLFDDFKGFYPLSFLQKAFYVIVDEIPKPNFPELREMGLGGFIDMDVNGITYKDTYYLLTSEALNLRIHFHELVHVAQWEHLCAVPFIERYISEIQTYGYDHAPLEEMAYAFDKHFIDGGEKIDVLNHVKNKLS